jgi:2-C-methyl-D-erythritol 2,4-cyclodiphosphate synthase
MCDFFPASASKEVIVSSQWKPSREATCLSTMLNICFCISLLAYWVHPRHRSGRYNSHEVCHGWIPANIAQGAPSRHGGRLTLVKLNEWSASATVAVIQAETTTKISSASAATIAKVQQLSHTIEDLSIRIGHGFDIHRMVPLTEAGQPIVIAGVTIDHDPLPWLDVHGSYHPDHVPNSIVETVLGVMAHSDGDVIYHSIVDAIFGALTLPDIGQVFADTDPTWRGCDSSHFMTFAYTHVLQHYGYQINNLDVTLILERPKVGKYIDQMKRNICHLLHTTPGRVNVKARTHERVDAVGELRAVSCHVVVTLQKKIESSISIESSTALQKDF